ncbi:MAG: protease inhibitor I42 family protein [Candidatus Omnitrophota bacterium]
MKLLILSILIFISSISLCLAEDLKPAGAIKVQVGQEFTLALGANATTGYEWQLAKPLDESSFKLISSEYLPDKTELVGAGGKQVWLLKALKSGEVTISFKYVRPWEKDAPPVEEKSFLIKIAEGD